jgi:hypothetical protein
MQPSDIISVLPEKFKNASEQIVFPSIVYEHQDIGLEVRSLQRADAEFIYICRASLSCDYVPQYRKKQWIGMLRDTFPFPRNPAQ